MMPDKQYEVVWPDDPSTRYFRSQMETPEGRAIMKQLARELADRIDAELAAEIWSTYAVQRKDDA